jgi:TetR/AcrR family transcriptional repressor of nem operon
MPRTSTARARLIDSACRLMHASTYATVSVDDICHDAGVRKGSFYYLFPSKRDLALAAIDEHWARARSGVHEPAFAPEVEPLQRVVRFFLRAAEQQRGTIVNGCPFGNLAIELSTQDAAIRDRARAVFGGYCAYFERAIRDAVASGANPDGDIEGRAQALLACFQGAMLLSKSHNDSRIVASVAEHALALIGGRKES